MEEHLTLVAGFQMHIKNNINRLLDKVHLLLIVEVLDFQGHNCLLLDNLFGNSLVS